jgi:hypothetical protein
VPIELRRGVTLPIPCRKCGKLWRWKLAAGIDKSACRSCGRATEVCAKETNEGWLITTELVTLEAVTR